MWRISAWAVVAAALVVWQGSSSVAMAANLEGVKVGDAAPAWSELPGTDGKQHSLGDLKDAKAIVVVFTCNHCPVAQAYQDRIMAIQKDYKDKGVQVVAVSVNTRKDDLLDKMIERAKEKDFNFPYLYDASQKIAKDFGAKVTPHVFLLDKDRKVAYIGAIDDNMKADKVEKKYLRDAIDAVLAGKAPEPAKTRAQGCGIEYKS